MVLSDSNPTFLAVLLVALICLYPLRSRATSKLPLPPGPRKLPVLGNLLDHPSTFEWETYMKWSKIHNSDILHLNMAGKSIVILSSMDAAVDLLQRKSAIYSDRPRLPMVNELMGWDFNFSFRKYGESWRAHRRLFHSVFDANAVKMFRPRELAATHELLRRLLHRPDNFMYHFRHMTGEIIMGVTYGIDVLPTDDPYVKLAQQAVEGLVHASIPGRFLVDSVPALKYVPEWFPGAGFRQKAKEWNALTCEMRDRPFVEAKRKIASGNAPESFTSLALRYSSADLGSETKADTETLVKETAGATFAAGSDTVLSSLGTFILAMVCNAEVQRRAQAEIDEVVIPGNLPDFADEPLMPYVSALVREVLRWQPVAPIGIPHYVGVEDEFRGYRIPAGSVVIANTWAILHDETVYPDPYTFKPERFLLNGKLNPAIPGPDALFGFGRRICPGRHLALSSLWLAVTSILATFNITKAVGEDGEVIAPRGEYAAELVLMPLPFKCSITPRSKEAETLIRGTVDREYVV
ncbi:cytochrome P450 [Roridomyces roridus]|uniref:Cytochrome P450 n=1 Tax=Roridomyces roridus TaxID=1738132 RepID=A0AAD7B1Z4_9AGAR|nr:cytochrome P450 [Roridomyces roridus]